ncbi:thioesterase family protein [Acidocella sp.]|uniref:acyl-CoA thioesterase n=1 Tax=Acidocella sp. TaxID=50710 RepID=UPI00261D75A1|nr:thioesterase family protein [Acidocella sp.]
MTQLPALGDFPCQTYDKLRYGDTDRQGHVNNAVFATFLETGRVALLAGSGLGLKHPDFSFVIARLELDYRGEVFWPGTVEIGSGIKSIGNSSASFVQAVYQEGRCVATAVTVIVQMDNKTRRPAPFGDEMRGFLSGLMLKA